MSTVLSERLPDTDEIQNAVNLLRTLSEPSPPALRGVVQGVYLAPAIAAAFADIARIVARGNGFVIAPIEAEMTTQQCADFLGVSRPYFVKLLDEGVLPHVKNGRHRRVKAADVFEYKRVRADVSRAALSELARIDGELGLI